MSKYLYPQDKLPTPQNQRLLELVGEGKRVLEVGCALGYQTRSLKDLQNCSVVGIEIDKKSAESASVYCDRIIVGDIESLDLARDLSGEKFDVITFADVLEHLKDPTQTLARVHEYLKPGGYILASIPNISHASIVFELAQGRFEYRNLGLLDSTHIRFFTRSYIYKTFEAAGYCITLLDRNIVDPHNTEFKTQALTAEDMNLLSYISERNPEYKTYQFIVKAIPLYDQNSLQSELIKEQEQTRLLRIDLERKAQEVRKLESNLKWIESKPLHRVARKLKQYFSDN